MNEPSIPLELVKYLEELIPNRDFDYKVPTRELDYYYGKRSVVVFLRSKYEEQNENILTKPLN